MQPYHFYKYNRETDSYLWMESVDAWDKNYILKRYDGTFFPEEVDKNKDGLIFILDRNLLDNQEYEEWRTFVLSDGKEIDDINFVNLTEKNISKLLDGELP